MLQLASGCLLGTVNGPGLEIISEPEPSGVPGGRSALGGDGGSVGGRGQRPADLH